nr:uncharacterized protein pb1a10.02 [Quercus suber]
MIRLMLLPSCRMLSKAQYPLTARFQIIMRVGEAFDGRMIKVPNIDLAPFANVATCQYTCIEARSSILAWLPYDKSSSADSCKNCRTSAAYDTKTRSWTCHQRTINIMEGDDFVQSPWSGSGTPTTPPRLIDHYQVGSFISTPELEREREENKKRLKSRFEQIFEKYEHDFTGIGDEIDLETGEVIVDNGHIARMKHEADPGTGKSTEDTDMIIGDVCSTSEDEDTAYDSDEYTEISNGGDGKGKEDAEDEEDEDDADDAENERIMIAGVGHKDVDPYAQADRPTTAPAMHEYISSIDRSLKTVANTIQNSALFPPENEYLSRNIVPPQNSTHENTASTVPFDLLDHLPALQRSIHDMQSQSNAGHVIDQNTIEALSRSIADQLVESLGTGRQSNKRKRSRDWDFPELPLEKRPNTRKPSSPMMEMQTHHGKPTREDELRNKHSIWAATGPSRKSRKPIPSVGTSDATSQVQPTQPSEGKRCSNCQITFTTSWRNSQHGILCNPCWMFYYRYGGMRPPRSPSPSIHESDVETKRYRANTSRRLANSRYATFTPMEDAMIIKLKEIDALTWENIALCFPERSAYALQNRYSKTLVGRPTIGRDTLIEQGFPIDHSGSMMARKAQFSRSEDKELVQLRLENKLSWSQIAARFAGQNAGTVEERFNTLTAIGPDQSRVSRNISEGLTLAPTGKQPRFSVEEDQQILRLREIDGLGWAEIATHFPGRSAGALQKRYTRKLVHGKTGLATVSAVTLFKDMETTDSKYSAADDARLSQSRDVDRMSRGSICKLVPQKERHSVFRRYRNLRHSAEDDIDSSSQPVLNSALTPDQQPKFVANKFSLASSSYKSTIDTSDIRSNALPPWHSGQHVAVTRKTYSDAEDGLILKLKGQRLKWEHIQLYMPSRTIPSLLSRYRELRRMPRPKNKGAERSLDSADLATTKEAQDFDHRISTREPIQLAAGGVHDCNKQDTVMSAAPAWSNVDPADDITACQDVKYSKSAGKVAALRPSFAQNMLQGSRDTPSQGNSSMPTETESDVGSTTKAHLPVIYGRPVPLDSSEVTAVLNAHSPLAIDPTTGSRHAIATNVRVNTFVRKRIAADPPEVDIPKEVDNSNVTHLSRRLPVRCISPVANSTPTCVQTYTTPTRHGANGLPYYVVPQLNHETPAASVPTSYTTDINQGARGPGISPSLWSTQHITESKTQSSDSERLNRHAGLPYRAGSTSPVCCPAPVGMQHCHTLETVEFRGFNPAARKRSIYVRGSTESESGLEDNSDGLHELKHRKHVNRQDMQRMARMGSRCSTADPADPDFVVGSETEHSDEDVADLDGVKATGKKITITKLSKAMPHDGVPSKSFTTSLPEQMATIATKASRLEANNVLTKASFGLSTSGFVNTTPMHSREIELNSDRDPAIADLAEGCLNALKELGDMQTEHRTKRRSVTVPTLTCPEQGSHDTGQGQAARERPQLTASCRDAHSRTSEECSTITLRPGSSDVQLVSGCHPYSNSMGSSRGRSIHTSMSSPSIPDERECGEEQETSPCGKPAYTTTELAIIALLSTPKHQMTNKAMFEWLGKEFPYVRTQKAVPNFEILKRNIRTRLNSSKYFGSAKGPHGGMVRTLRREAYEDILDKKLQVAPYDARLLQPEESNGKSEDEGRVQFPGQTAYALRVRSPPDDIGNTTTPLAERGDASVSGMAAKKRPKKIEQSSSSAVKSSASQNKHRVFDPPKQQATAVTSVAMHDPSRSTPLQSRLPQIASNNKAKPVRSRSSPLYAISKDGQEMRSIHGRSTPSTRAKKPDFKTPLASSSEFSSSLMTSTMYDPPCRSNSVALPGSNRRVVCTPALEREISDSEDELAL